jgi:hypothetical protein
MNQPVSPDQLHNLKIEFFESFVKEHIQQKQSEKTRGMI